MNSRLLLAIASVVVIGVGTACAQPAWGREGPAGKCGPGMMCRFEAGPHHGMMCNFFPPVLVMRHQQEIGLTPEQQSALKDEMVKFAGHVTDLQWQKSASEGGALANLLKEPKPDEKAALAEKEKLLKIEGDLQLSHLALLIRVKNILTPAQQAQLTAMRERMEHRFMGGRHGMWRHGRFGEGPGFGHFGRGMMNAPGGPMHERGMKPGGPPPAAPSPSEAH